MLIKDLPKTSGVYLMHNSVTSDIYVGSTQNIRVRVSNHLSCLRRGVHPSWKISALSRSIGEAPFSFEVLELCPVGDLCERERHWVNILCPTLNSPRVVGNVLRGAERRIVEKPRARFIRAIAGIKNRSEWAKRVLGPVFAVLQPADVELAIKELPELRGLLPE